MKYACIHSHLGKFRLRLMWRVLGVSASGFYAWKKRGPSERSKQDRSLLVEIERCHKASRGSYGSPRVFRSLKEERGLQLGEKRVARLMREAGLRAKTSRRFRATTDSAHAFPIAPNVLRRRSVQLLPERRTESRHLISPISLRVRGGSISRSCWISLRAASWAGACERPRGGPS